MLIDELNAYKVIKTLSEIPKGMLLYLLKGDALDQLVSRIISSHHAHSVICEFHHILSQNHLSKLLDVVSLTDTIASQLLTSGAKFSHDDMIRCVRMLSSHNVKHSWDYLSPEVRNIAIKQITSKRVATRMLAELQLTDSQRAILQDIS